MPLTWKSNYWIKGERTTSLEDMFAPELTPDKLDSLFERVRDVDKDYLRERGIVLMGIPKLIYYESPYVYFKDLNGTYVIRKDMRPNEDNRISYYAWGHKNFLENENAEHGWVFAKNVTSDV